jgi:regulator of sigma E protease
MLTTLLAFAVVLGTTVVIHEFGHFAAAKLLGMRVDVFSVGFGKRLFGYTWGETDYRLSLLPLGGYVKIMGMEPEEEGADDPRAYHRRPKWHQLIVLVAGPLMNIVLALAIPFFIGMFLFKAPAFLNKPAVVGAVPLGSAAEKAGIKAGDRIVKFSGIENPTWSKVRDYTLINDNRPIPVTVLRDGKAIDLTLTPSARKADGNSYGEAGLLTEDYPNAAPSVASVAPGMPAADAGLLANDKLVKFNGQPIPNFAWMKESLQAFEDQKIILTVERDGKPVDLTITPKRIEGEVRVGFSPNQPPPLPTVSERKSVAAAAEYAINENLRVIVLTGEAFKQIFKGNRNLRETVSGPIGIAKASGDAYKGGGLEGLLMMTMVLSLNLGIFNLLPIPVLDGGHILIILIESFIGWFGLKLTNAVKNSFNYAGFAVLMLLMAFVIFNDVSRLIPGGGEKKPTPPPPPATASPGK